MGATKKDLNLFNKKEVKKIKKFYSKDREFKINFIRIRNAWILTQITPKTAVKLVKKEIEKAGKRN